MSIVFLGGGNMASAIIGGLIVHSQPANEIKVVEIDAAAGAALANRWKVAVGTSLEAALQDASTLILAVKPQQLPQALAAVGPVDPSLRVISIAAGISTSTLSALLGGHQNLVRTMPNTPALIGEGVTALYALPQVSEEDRLHAQSLMRAVGATLWLSSEDQMDAVTAISGSGPAYVFLLEEALMAAAQAQGLAPELSRTLVLQTVKGAALLASNSSDTPELLRQRVTSKGGTTEAAINTLEQQGFRQAFLAAIEAATERSRQLGQNAPK
jgi:pyrroline-5-carboxylate reductase